MSIRPTVVGYEFLRLDFNRIAYVMAPGFFQSQEHRDEASLCNVESEVMFITSVIVYCLEVSCWSTQTQGEVIDHTGACILGGRGFCLFVLLFELLLSTVAL